MPTTPVEVARAQRSAEHDERRKRNTEAIRRWAHDFGPGAKTFLSKRTGLTFAAASRIVDGKAQPSPETARLIEAAIGVSAAEVLGIESPTVATRPKSARAVRTRRAS